MRRGQLAARSQGQALRRIRNRFMGRLARFASRGGSCRNADHGANWLAWLLTKLESWHPSLWAICGPRVAVTSWFIAIPTVAITAQS
jgi:hypothetical protein